MHNSRTTTHRRQSRQLVSARRPAAYERPDDDGLLTEQFFDSRIKLVTVCPEAALMYAVLEDAFLCFDKQFEADPRLMRRAREAEKWFFSDEFRGLFSFASVCDALGLEPHYLRTKLKHWILSRLDKVPAER